MKLDNLADRYPVTEFAGFQWPKYVWTLPKGRLNDRLKDRKNRCTGDYFSLAPNYAEGWIGFYEGEGNPSGLAFDLRLEKCKYGYYADLYQNQTLYGIVLRLPHDRGFLVGYSAGEGMCAAVKRRIYSDLDHALIVADDLAGKEAEKWQEDHLKYMAEQAIISEREKIASLRKGVLGMLKDSKRLRKNADGHATSEEVEMLTSMVRSKVRVSRAKIKKSLQKIKKWEDEPWTILR